MCVPVYAYGGQRLSSCVSLSCFYLIFWSWTWNLLIRLGCLDSEPWRSIWLYIPGIAGVKNPRLDFFYVCAADWTRLHFCGLSTLFTEPSQQPPPQTLLMPLHNINSKSYFCILKWQFSCPLQRHLSAWPHLEYRLLVTMFSYYVPPPPPTPAHFLTMPYFLVFCSSSWKRRSWY